MKVSVSFSLVIGLMAAACMVAPPATRGAAVPDQPGSYDVRPWSAPASETALGSAAQPGKVQPEPATPHSLAVHWPIKGDDNGNAEVKVSYRAAPDGEWREGFPLFWVHPERAPDYMIVPNGRLFAGSIVDLRPSTKYQLRLELIDPDGGSTSRELSLTTTGEPVEPAGLRQRHVVPDPGGQGGGSGSAADPYRGLAAALAKAAPGDLILLHGGVYQAGGTVLAKSGAPGKPIILRAAGDGQVILDGGDQAHLFDISGQSHIWFEQLTFRNAHKIIVAPKAKHIVIRRNRFELMLKRKAAGIDARNTRGRETTGFFVTDNVFSGPSTWPRKTKKKGPPEQVFAIGITGSGHEIAFNRMVNVGDGMNNGSGGHISASDVHNNDVISATDDCIEADHSTTNLRVYRNRLTNCHYGISAQPVRGGPTYIFRNMILNTKATPFKLHNHTSGVLLFHNTSVRKARPFLMRPGGDPIADVITRNNIFIGDGKPALRAGKKMVRSDFDRDGYAWGDGDFAKWNRTKYRSMSDTLGSDGPYAVHGAVGLRSWGELESGLQPPRDIKDFQEAELNDPRLASGSRAVDRGVPIANFNDGYAGEAPDLGCCELGEALPHFGPRP